MGVLFVFVDGVGLGPAGPHNPFTRRWPGLERSSGCPWLDEAWVESSGGGVTVRSLDASLGMPGLPQSATGQTALLTGHNAAAMMGGHYGPWPGPTLRRVLDAGTVFHDGLRAGGAALANVYPPWYPAATAPTATGGGDGRMGGARRTRRSAIVHAALAAGLTLADLDAYRAGAAVAADLDGAFFAELRAEPRATPPPHPPTPVARPLDVEAVRAQADRLLGIARRHAFTLFDVWATDRAGHQADLGAATAVLERLDAFLAALVAARGHDLTLLLTSDHGNLEDLSSRRHTHARVPLVVHGPGAAAFADATALPDVATGVKRLLATTAG